MKLGKLPPRLDPRTLKLRKYLRDVSLSPPPASVDYSPAVMAAGGFPIMMNDSLGDCVCAGIGHAIQTWTANAGKIVTPTDAQIIAAYEMIGGYNPSDPSTDQGCDELTALNDWRQTGVAGDTIQAYAAIGNDPIELMQAIDLFGVAYLGVSLPDAVVSVPDLLAADWTQVYGPKNPSNGHCIILVGYNPWICVTWGAIKPLSLPFIEAYTDEKYAIVSRDFINAATAKSVAGLDWPTMQLDLQQVTS